MKSTSKYKVDISILFCIILFAIISIVTIGIVKENEFQKVLTRK